jgi:uncharacterized membrane protein YcaP (DUF421 family)
MFERVGWILGALAVGLALAGAWGDSLRDVALRALVVYFFLLLIIRVAGRRSISQMTPFDLILILVIGGIARSGIIENAEILKKCVVAITTLILIDVLLSLLKRSKPSLDQLLDGMPLIIVDRGRPLEQLIKKSRLSKEDILSAARLQMGLEKLDQIKYAVLEVDGNISIIPQ